MLRQSLRSLGADTLALIAAAGLDPTARAEEVSVEQFVGLARILKTQRSRRCAIEKTAAPGDKTA
jgi:16S rRNA (adenine1518-N6/adenine1519-N6)-dimethyltransferase